MSSGIVDGFMGGEVDMTGKEAGFVVVEGKVEDASFLSDSRWRLDASRAFSVEYDGVRHRNELDQTTHTDCEILSEMLRHGIPCDVTQAQKYQ